jgi:hypothetical protein
MARQNYAELDEDDFYGQDFDRDGVVSIWVGLDDQSIGPDGIDVLQDLCGVGYYDLDKQDAICHDFALFPLRSLVMELSYAPSFCEDVRKKATEFRINRARYVIAQYDFGYDPSRVKRKIEKDPVFLGFFKYSRANKEK